MGKERNRINQRVVLDTNCVISALLFSKHSMAWLRHSWQNAHITPLASKDTVNELMRVLAYPKFNLSKAEQALLLADFYLTPKPSSLSQSPMAYRLFATLTIKNF